MVYSVADRADYRHSSHRDEQGRRDKSLGELAGITEQTETFYFVSEPLELFFDVDELANDRPEQKREYHQHYPLCPELAVLTDREHFCKRASDADEHDSRTECFHQRITQFFGERIVGDEPDKTAHEYGGNIYDRAESRHK